MGLGDTNHRGDEPGEMGDNLSIIELGTNFEVIIVACGGYHTCALSTSNDVKCFGANWYGELGSGHTQNIGDSVREMVDILSVVNLGTTFTAIQIKCGYALSCALSANFEVKCWGFNDRGQLGQGDTEHRGDNINEMGDNLIAIDLGSNFRVSSIRLGPVYVCAVSVDQDVKCWGGNGDGILGLGDTTPRGYTSGQMGDDLPALDLGTGFVPQLIGGGNGHNLALSINDSLKSWGLNSYGELGYGDTNNRGDEPNEMGQYLSTIDLGSGYTVFGISTSYFGRHSCALLENGTDFVGLKCWGYNVFGQLGLGDTDHRGDQVNEMGDELSFIYIKFPALSTPTPTSNPTADPTSHPSADPTLNPTESTENLTSYPTQSPTVDATVNPTIIPSDNPTTDPTNEPSESPTVIPTEEPTTKCESYQNCTECANSNSMVPQCFWHFSDEICYHFNELDDDTNVVYEKEQCTTPHPTNDPTENPTVEPTTECYPYQNCTECTSANTVVPQCFWHFSIEKCYHFNELNQEEFVVFEEEECTTAVMSAKDSSSANLLSNGVFEWILLSVIVVMICIMALVVLCLLQRRRNKRTENKNDEVQAVEMNKKKSNPPPVVRVETMEIPPGGVEHEHSFTVNSMGSRGEGMETGHGNNTHVRKESEV